VTLQVADAKVLIPTTGRVSAQDINAVKDLRLITNPAAGLCSVFSWLNAQAFRFVTHSSICCKWHKLRLLNAGYNNIDIEAAKARGVPVCTAPGYNAASVAEGALMMMLMLARRVHEQEVSPDLPLSSSSNGPALVPSSIWTQATLSWHDLKRIVDGKLNDPNGFARCHPHRLHFERSFFLPLLAANI